ncbi:aldehyde dehydrogenase family protein [Rhodocaloribacter litoris]|uniref:aldehyde dehydrogenase family protein n=1 Tax=Rhodocaloribacter litoris TaxID=2558931 RepID=UPI00141D8593|nr:aldehyde dehydrogenase family protein [Rhodocaloribacter litoris]QXD14352.1 aldehyde dehydrogenase family protein [Rhodocaloribacter litoris]GIV60627.1 MAG: aldehyde dehydrogenase [Rhodothermaceae bacterium]
MPSTREADPPPAEILPPNLTAEIERLFTLQGRQAEPLRRTTAAQRIRKLRRLRAALMAHRPALHAALHADFRKPPEEVDLTEIGPVLIELRHAIAHLPAWMRPKKVRTPFYLIGTSAEVRYEPKGRGLILAPWNYPVNLTLGPLVGAVAAGCPVILKPSEHCPHTGRLLKELLATVFPESEVAVIEGDRRVAQALLRRPFDHIYFTGGTAVGRLVMQAAAEHLASVTLELGGKSPVIVDETADVEDAAEKIAFGKFSNAGQTCIAPDHVFVHESRHDAFVQALTAQIRAFYGADAGARAASPGYARIVNDHHFARLRACYDEALAAGATPFPGAAHRAGDRFIDPVVLTGVPPDVRLMREEIFGPLLPVIPFRHLDEAVRRINEGGRPLTLYVFSRKRDNVAYVLDRTTAGSTCVNDTLLPFIHPELPFGGAGPSGIGRAHGYRTFLAFSNERAVLRQRLRRTPLKRFYPPYTRTTRRLIAALLKLLGA